MSNYTMEACFCNYGGGKQSICLPTKLKFQVIAYQFRLLRKEF